MEATKRQQDIQKTLEVELTKRQNENQESFRLLRSVMYTYIIVTKLKVRQRRFTRVHHLEWMAKVLGINIHLILAETGYRSALNMFARWHFRLPLGLGRVLTGHLKIRDSGMWLPRLALRPQNIIPHDSDIIKACQSGAIAEIQAILSAKKAHPNDKTLDNDTVFWVGRYVFWLDHCVE